MNKKAFTLIEILIAGAIFAETAVVGAVTIANVTRTQGITVNDGLKQEALRSTLDRIDREVHTAQSVTFTADSIQITHEKSATITILQRSVNGRNEIVASDGTNTQSLTPQRTTVTSFAVSGIPSADPSGKPPYVYVTMAVDTTQSSSVPLTASTFVVPRGWTL